MLDSQAVGRRRRAGGRGGRRRWQLLTPTAWNSSKSSVQSRMFSRRIEESGPWLGFWCGYMSTPAAKAAVAQKIRLPNSLEEQQPRQVPCMGPCWQAAAAVATDAHSMPTLIARMSGSKGGGLTISIDLLLFRPDIECRQHRAVDLIHSHHGSADPSIFLSDG